MRKGGNAQTNNNNSKNQKKLIEPAQCKKLFTKFSHGKQTMNDDDLFAFLSNDLGLAADDQIFGHIATNIMNISKIQSTTYDNFAGLFNYTHSATLHELQVAVKDQKFKDELKNNENYKSMYRKLFSLYSGKFTTLDFEVAQALWQVYLKGKLKYYNQFFQYLNSLAEKPKIHKDSWNMMYDFSVEVKDFKDCTQQDGWPILIDNFVEWMKNKK